MSKTVKKQTGPRPRRQFSARVKCEAVLSIWSERRKPADVCRELGIKWSYLSHWQKRALAAMHEALEPRGSKEDMQGPALGAKLEKLLDRTEQRAQRISKLEKRLERIQTEEPKKTAVSGKS